MSLLLGYDRFLLKQLALFLLVGVVCLSGSAGAEELTLGTVQSWLQENGAKFTTEKGGRITSCSGHRSQ